MSEELQHSALGSDVAEQRSRVHLISDNFTHLFGYGGALNDDTSDTQWYRMNIELEDNTSLSTQVPGSDMAESETTSPPKRNSQENSLTANKNAQDQTERTETEPRDEQHLSVPPRLSKASETTLETYGWNPCARTEAWQRPTPYVWSTKRTTNFTKAAASDKEQEHVGYMDPEHFSKEREASGSRIDKDVQEQPPSTSTTTTRIVTMTKRSGSAKLVIHPVVALVQKLSLSMSGIDPGLLNAVRDHGRLGRDLQVNRPGGDFWDELDAEVYSLPHSLKNNLLVKPSPCIPAYKRDSRFKILCHLRESPNLSHPLGTRESAYEASRQYISALRQISPQISLSTPLQVEQLFLCDQVIYVTGHLRRAILTSDVQTLEDLNRLLADTLLSLEVLICVEKVMRFRVLKRASRQSR